VSSVRLPEPGGLPLRLPVELPVELPLPLFSGVVCLTPVLLCCATRGCSACVITSVCGRTGGRDSGPCKGGGEASGTGLSLQWHHINTTYS
jgi:hypothetical protein